ncbi:hypothetical protein KKR91_08880 [Arthrobacter jiangjiafuii]|uniref:Uncharacterized protein n=1 Tax=Arthrobacter jiangjiafuii TaxID=2817475 RepID=A0A975QZN3_9MICC|nr:hypothetical protein [Arthrobacter jiangjiafuii]MBP3043114.1 hypothetical protein [Arthrobacter jiangjiafuii]QWC08673.1 hypothetical protein KKR91_08880 [Arthrobacter jiangjiafuii]
MLCSVVTQAVTLEHVLRIGERRSKEPLVQVRHPRALPAEGWLDGELR